MLLLSLVGARVRISKMHLPKAVDAEIEPEGNDIFHSLEHGWVTIVEIRLTGEKLMKIELLSLFIVFPS